MFSPALYSILTSQWKPYKFDWREFLRIELLDDVEIIADSSGSSTLGNESGKEKGHNDVEAITTVFGVLPSEASSNVDVEKISPAGDKLTAGTIPKEKRIISLDDITHPFSDEILAELHHWYKIAWIFWVVVVLVTFVLWPLTLYRNYIFTKSFFSGWKTVAIV